MHYCTYFLLSTEYILFVAFGALVELGQRSRDVCEKGINIGLMTALHGQKRNLKTPIKTRTLHTLGNSSSTIRKAG
jgi:hypothetical protein